MSKMAGIGSNSPSDARRGHQSPRPKGRENLKNILCRNVTLYGNCRAQNNGCPYNHEVAKASSQNDNNNSSLKRFLNVDSPSFTPLSPATNAAQPAGRSFGISPKAATAAVFTPKGASTPTHTKQSSSEWTQRDFQEFVPQNFAPASQTNETNSTGNALNSFDPFNLQASLAGVEASQHGQINPYAQDGSAINAASLFQNAATFAHPLNYHLYAPMGPHREDLMAYQRTTHDFFIPDHLREELQRKSEATLQTFPNSTLPQQLEHFHSLVALDINAQKAPSVFGYTSWVYKAVSTKNGMTYALRRLEGFRLTDERAIRTIQTWKRINSGSVVTVHDAFTTRAFGDSSLIVVTDYHPLSQTLSEKHFAQPPKHSYQRGPSAYISDTELWGYIVQLASGLKAIHAVSLAARLVIPQKILVTSKNRLRLNACGILDITQFDQNRNSTDLQQDDLSQLGRLILCLATRSPTAHLNTQKSLEQITRVYSEKLREVVTWLLTPQTATTTTTTTTTSPSPSARAVASPPAASQTPEHTIDTFLNLISAQVVQSFDSTLHQSDVLTSQLSRELENARLVRLVTKLNVILERPDPTASMPAQNASNPNQSAPPHTLNMPSSAWSETGERYYLKLFRDYVFHQVDADGRPVLDLGHVLGCLNKLDAGVEEKILLVSRDEQNCFVVSFREVKRGFESAWAELMKAGSGAGRR